MFERGLGGIRTHEGLRRMIKSHIPLSTWVLALAAPRRNPLQSFLSKPFLNCRPSDAQGLASRFVTAVLNHLDQYVIFWPICYLSMLVSARETSIA